MLIFVSSRVDEKRSLISCFLSLFSERGNINCLAVERRCSFQCRSERKDDSLLSFHCVSSTRAYNAAGADRHRHRHRTISKRRRTVRNAVTKSIEGRNSEYVAT